MPAKSVRVWVVNTERIIGAVADHPEVLGETIPPDVLELFRSFLHQWDVLGSEHRRVPLGGQRQGSRRDPRGGHWAKIDAMNDDQLERLRIGWSSPDGEPFFRALTVAGTQAHQVGSVTEERLKCGRC